MCPSQKCHRQDSRHLRLVLRTLFMIAPSWKLIKCPSTCEEINKWCYVHFREYDAAIKTNELLVYVATWMILKIIVLSEQSRTKEEYILNDSFYGKF